MNKSYTNNKITVMKKLEIYIFNFNFKVNQNW